MPARTPILALLSLIFFAAAPARAWDAPGHRLITYLALDGLAPTVPDFLKDDPHRRMVAWESGEPDRIRSTSSLVLRHINTPDHYLDVEDLDHFGLTLGSLPELRNQYLTAMIIARHEHPDQAAPWNPALDPADEREFPGFLPYAIIEHHARLTGAFKTYRLLLKANDPARADQLEATRAEIIVEMGLLSHFVGDAAQPLHTTRHFNGWVGDNPHGYTTDHHFHAFIDGEVLTLHHLDYAALKPTQTFARAVDAKDPWNDILGYIQTSFDHVVPLYDLEKSGDLKAEPGKAFIAERLHDAADMLAALYNTAWAASEPTEKDVTDFTKYDTWTPKETPVSPTTK